MASTNRFEVLADEDETPSPVTEHDDPGESAQDLAAHVVHMQTAALKVVTLLSSGEHKISRLPAK